MLVAPEAARRCSGAHFSEGKCHTDVKLRQWFIAVASSCRRCGGRLTPTRIYTARSIHEIVAAGVVLTPIMQHAFEEFLQQGAMPLVG
jgi:hypothetical protein